MQVLRHCLIVGDEVRGKVSSDSMASRRGDQKNGSSNGGGAGARRPQAWASLLVVERSGTDTFTSLLAVVRQGQSQG